MRVLLLESESELAMPLKRRLESSGYSVDVAQTRVQGLGYARAREYAALVLDTTLCGGTAVEVVEALRGDGHSMPILLLAERPANEDIVRGLDAGADDYMLKPPNAAELVGRVRTLLRRSSADRLARLAYADLELDRIHHRAHRRGRDLSLTPREFQLLEYLMLHAEEVVHRTQLMEGVWGVQFNPETNVIAAQMRNLRRKLGRWGDPPLIHTVRGLGYVLGERARLRHGRIMPHRPQPREG